MTQPRIVVICQARTGSSRLPSKVMLPLAGAPLLVRFMERVKRAFTPSIVVVATTTLTEDDPLVALCDVNGYPVFRGHPTDLLDRHLACAEAYEADVVVKIPSDCPLIDPEIIDRVISTYLDHLHDVDAVSNLHPPTFPDGNDVEVMSIDVLRAAAVHATEHYQREHTTPWIWENVPPERRMNVTMLGDLDLSRTHRWTIDYAEDYMFIKAVYDALYVKDPRFTMKDILRLIRDRPEISALNQRFVGQTWYRPNAR